MRPLSVTLTVYAGCTHGTPRFENSVNQFLTKLSHVHLMNSFDEQPLPFLMDEAITAMPVMGKQPSYIADHRQRLRARFMA